MSDFGLQLREKQKARRIYGVLERQFRRHFEHAEGKPGVTGENLLQELEMRLDNMVYRLGFADSIGAEMLPESVEHSSRRIGVIRNERITIERCDLRHPRGQAAGVRRGDPLWGGGRNR